MIYTLVEAIKTGIAIIAFMFILVFKASSTETAINLLKRDHNKLYEIVHEHSPISLQLQINSLAREIKKLKEDKK